MNWADSKIHDVSERAKEQQPYGSPLTLLFGLTMSSFFIVTYMSINNFTFRAMCVRYLMYPLPWIVVVIGYCFCFVYLVLAFYSFLVYFRLAKPIGKGLDVTTMMRLGIPISESQQSKGGSKSSVASRKSILPLPGWATETTKEVETSPKRSKASGRSPASSSKLNWNSDSSPTSPKGRSARGSPYTSSPYRLEGKDYASGSPGGFGTTGGGSSPWRSQTPSRLTSPLNYPKHLSSPSYGGGGGGGGGGGPAGSSLSPSSISGYGTPKSFQKAPESGSSPMIIRTSNGKSEPLIYPSSVSSPSYYTAPVQYDNTPSAYSYYSTTGGTGTLSPAWRTRGAESSRSPSSPGPRLATTTSTPTNRYSTTVYSSPRAGSNFSIEDYTTTMSPLSSISRYGTYGSKEFGTPNASIGGPIGSRGTPNPDFAFSDQTQLDEYVELQRRIETTKDYLNPDGTSSAGGGGRGSLRPVKLPTYQSMAIRKSSDKPSSSKDGAYMDDRLAMMLYAKEGLTEHMDMWSENMRAWLSQNVFKPLVKWFDEVVEHMGKDALYQAQLSQVQSGVQKLQTQQASMFSVKPTVLTGGVGATATSTQSQQQQQQQHLAQRIKLERLLGDFGSSREYVVERIRTLAQGAVLQSYNWCGGGKWKDKEWSTDLPTDAAIVCHLFGTHLDELVVPTDAAHLHDAFRSRYLVGKDETAKKPAFAIYQRSVNPPHYNIVVNHNEWHVLRGRNNLFDALCLFVHVVQKDYNGVLDQRYLGGKIGLLEVISTD